MKISRIIILILSVITVSCNTQTKKSEKDYVLIDENGISVEKFDSIHINSNQYTENNVTFIEGSEFTYDFEHISSENEKLFFEWDESVEDPRKKWQFVPLDSIDENTIQKVRLLVKPGLEPMVFSDPDYNQTIINYTYSTKVKNAPFSSHTGLIENEDNIWMHPPRDQYFSILELNPFPFIKAPFEIGNEWKWSLNIGDGWSDQRWKVWEGGILNQYNYEITDRRTLTTDLGDIKCWVIEATASSRIGKTKLTAFFNSTYGFVQLNYTNIDGSLTNLTLTDFAKT